MRELNVALTEESIRAVRALQSRIGPDDVYLYLWLFLDQWCIKETCLFEINTSIFLHALSQIDGGLEFSSFAHELMEDVLAEIDNGSP